MEERKLTNTSEFLLQKLSNYFRSPIALDRDERISGAYAWLVLIVFVFLYDLFSIKTNKSETMTRYFWRVSDKRIKKVVLLLTWCTLTGHLLFEKSVRRKIFSTFAQKS